jgi:hypothetical protein
VRVCSAGPISATCSAARLPRRAPFLGWTLIGWIIALIWSCTGNTAANFYRLEAGAIGPNGPIPPRRSGSLWLALILILVAIVLLHKRRDFRDVRSFDFTFRIMCGFEQAGRRRKGSQAFEVDRSITLLGLRAARSLSKVSL